VCTKLSKMTHVYYGEQFEALAVFNNTHNDALDLQYLLGL